MKKLSMEEGLEMENIVKLHDVLEDSDSVHLVMELCRGGSLSDLLSEKKRKTGNSWLLEEEAARIMKSLLIALEACHSRGIIHRDVKPANILFLHKDQEPTCLKLADFGMATRTSSLEVEDVTEVRTLVGTPVFMAPEILQGEYYGQEVDMWSAGVLLYIMLTADTPHSTVSLSSKDHDHRWTSISQSAKSLVQGLLCRDPESRMTASRALIHPWIRHSSSGSSSSMVWDSSFRVTTASSLATSENFLSIMLMDISNVSYIDHQSLRIVVIMIPRNVPCDMILTLLHLQGVQAHIQ